MASKPISLQVKPRGKKIPKLPTTTSIFRQGSTSDLYHRIAAEANIDVHQLRINSEQGKLIPNDKKTSVESCSLSDGSIIQVKDLGLQVAWRTVFVIEYIGPLLIHPLVYLLRPYIYSNAPVSAAPLQTLSCLLIVLHFIKREFETFFVHRFSNGTMPAFNIIKNSAHYWLLAGVVPAYFIYSPTAVTASPINPLIDYPAVAVYAVAEFANLNTHLVLKNLRAAGSTDRGVPHGWGFDLVTCPNYLYEAIAWIAMTVVTRHWSTAVFTATAAGIMAIWAKKKERRYRKESSQYKKKKFAMFPGII